MTRALMTGITGLRTHQQKLDVVANNLANMNTVGYKSQSTVFSDLMYSQLRSGARASETSGGVNPQMIGSGVQMAQISRNFQQGALQSTGQMLDFALQGEGFFQLSAGSGENVYSRAGSFQIDPLGRLVDPSTGLFVQRFGTLGESEVEGLNFQVAGDKRINVPLGVSIPGEETGNVDFIGNVPSTSLPPATEILTSFAPFETATGVAAGTTPLNDLLINTVDYAAGDTIEISGTNPDGTPFSGSINAAGATLGDLVNEVNNLITGATATMNPDGTISVTADDEGDAFLSLTFADAAGNVGSTNFLNNSMVVTTEGHDGDHFELTMEVFDKRGGSHQMTFDFHKTSNNTWDVSTSMPQSSGTIIQGDISGVTFNDDGTYALVGAAGAGNPSIQLQFNAVSEPTTISIDFSRLTHMATGFSMTQTQDGFSPGTLESVAVSGTGVIDGIASNGRILPIAQLALASFSNASALDAIGNNYFQESASSGAATVGEALAGGRGSVVGGQLEDSNVEIALEFTQLIVAQRGFSANARTITVSDEMLEELTNIIR